MLLMPSVPDKKPPRGSKARLDLALLLSISRISGAETDASLQDNSTTADFRAALTRSIPDIAWQRILSGEKTRQCRKRRGSTMDENSASREVETGAPRRACQVLRPPHIVRPRVRLSTVDCRIAFASSAVVNYAWPCNKLQSYERQSIDSLDATPSNETSLGTQGRAQDRVAADSRTNSRQIPSFVK